jgi:hypothetical protein
MVRVVGGPIVTLNVQPQADDRAIASRGVLHMAKQRAKDALAARRRHDVDALDPPEPAVAPVAVLEGDAELADNLAVALGEEIPPLAGVLQYGTHATLEERTVQLFPLAFMRQQAVELCDDCGVGRPRAADDDGHVARSRCDS